MGNGRNVFIWHDFGPLKARFEDKVLYDAASNEGTKMTQFLSEEGWNKPLHVSAAPRSIVEAWP